MFSNSILIKISGVSRATFFRKKQLLRNQKVITEKLHDKFLDDETAKKVAEAMGFKLEFEAYIKKKIEA